MYRRSIFAIALVPAAVLLLIVAGASAQGGLTPQEQLGEFLFFDENLSLNGNQSCATCHAAEVGYTGPDSAINAHGAVYEGSIPGAFGDRKPPTAAYGGASPVLYYDADEELWIGGMFWDGRATGQRLGDALAEQAQGPFLNPKEQALPNAEAVIAKVQGSDYAGLFAEQCPGELTAELYDCIGYAIAAYERSSEVNPFTSKYDYYLKGEAKLTGIEMRGLELFEGKAMCSACHLSQPDEFGNPPLFTDFTYDNLGIPKNLENPETIANPTWADPGLGGFLRSAGYPKEVWEAELGKHKVPTLRNVDLRFNKKFVKAFGHNGYFKSLEEITHFYNTRDVEKEDWPAAEVPETVNTDELGDLGLTRGEENAIVAFMKTLSDGYVPPGGWRK
jgi:cytochrome c peroxidase